MASQCSASWKRRRKAWKVLKGCSFKKDVRKKKQKHHTKPVSAIKGNLTKRQQTRFVYKSCSKKVRWRSQAEATRNMHEYEKKTDMKGRTYFCDLCHGWHVTFSHHR